MEVRRWHGWVARDPVAVPATVHRNAGGLSVKRVEALGFQVLGETLLKFHIYL